VRRSSTMAYYSKEGKTKGGGSMPRRLSARPPRDQGEAHHVRQLAHSRQAPADWIIHAKMVARSWEASSKTCSGCGWVNEDLTLRDRPFERRNPQAPCGLVLDRDLSAAINLRKLAGSASESRNACGEESAGQGHVALVKLSPLNQEPNAVLACGIDGQVLENGL
jgi:putative transposase